MQVKIVAALTGYGQARDPGQGLSEHFMKPVGMSMLEA